MDDNDVDDDEHGLWLKRYDVTRVRVECLEQKSV